MVSNCSGTLNDFESSEQNGFIAFGYNNKSWKFVIFEIKGHKSCSKNGLGIRCVVNRTWKSFPQAVCLLCEAFL